MVIKPSSFTIAAALPPLPYANNVAGTPAVRAVLYRLHYTPTSTSSSVISVDLLHPSPPAVPNVIMPISFIKASAPSASRQNYASSFPRAPSPALTPIQVPTTQLISATKSSKTVQLTSSSAPRLSPRVSISRTYALLVSSKPMPGWHCLTFPRASAPFSCWPKSLAALVAPITPPTSSSRPFSRIILPSVMDSPKIMLIFTPALSRSDALLTFHHLSICSN